MDVHRYKALLVLLLATALATGLLTLVGTKPAEAAFPGNNGEITFHTNRDGNYEIYTMNSDGSNQTNLTNHGGDDEFPVYSPDGRQIAFRSNRDTVNNPTGDYEIYRMSASGGRVTQLTSNTDDADTATSWQPLP